MSQKLLRAVSLGFLLAASSGALVANASEGSALNEIRTELERWNEAARAGDLARFMALFDDSDQVMLVGSDKGEVYRGKAAIRGWVAQLFEHNRFSWDISRPVIDRNGNTAWVFVDGTMTITSDGGPEKKTPYRFAGVLVKRGASWKWRLFDGSIPAGE